MKCLFGLSSVSFSYGNIHDWNKNMSAPNWIIWGWVWCSNVRFKMWFDDDMKPSIHGIICSCVCVCSSERIWNAQHACYLVISLIACLLQPADFSSFCVFKCFAMLQTAKRYEFCISYIFQRIYTFSTDSKALCFFHRVRYILWTNKQVAPSRRVDEMQAAKVCLIREEYWIAEVFL